MGGLSSIWPPLSKEKRLFASLEIAALTQGARVVRRDQRGDDERGDDKSVMAIVHPLQR
jgi:hypothetical protein